MARAPGAEPIDEHGFRGRIEHLPVGPLELSTVTAGSRTCDARGRWSRRVRASSCWPASSSAGAAGSSRTAGRLLGPGDMAFYDSTRPMSCTSTTRSASSS
ncbi:hypothetical protein HBB16_00225 [Pseudonocardia sp. MCCB 268]|nr:hypothetical protein [Pseudonocardia cytotoxica]